MEFTIPMALVDMLPVILFGAAGIILMRDLYNKMSKGAFAIFAAGIIDVFEAGLLKAVYKLLYAAGVCVFEPLTQMFFPVQSIGFVLAGLGMIAMATHEQGEGKVYSVAPVWLLFGMIPVLGAAKEPAVFKGTMIFVVLMVVGLGAFDTVLCIISAKLKKIGAIPLFVVSFIFALMMGYLSSKDFDKASLNWIAEGVNTVGQGSLLVAVHILHKAGLGKMKLKK